jgi:uncharacterized protein YoxC
MRTLLIVLTLIELAVLVLVLAVYLIAIAARLRNISHTLGLVTFGVRAIEKQTDPIGPVVGEINEALEKVASALEQVVGPVPAETAAPAAGAPDVHVPGEAESGPGRSPEH